MSSHSPKVSEGIVHAFSKSILECPAGVFRDTLHENFRNTHQAFTTTTRINQSSSLLCGLSEVSFRKDVARTNVCINPGTHVSSLLFWRGVQLVVVSCHWGIT